MLLEPAALAPLPPSCIPTCTPSIQQEELVKVMPPLSATALTFSDELFFDLHDIIMQDNHETYDGIPTSSNIEEQCLLAAEPNYLCVDDIWHGSDIMLHEHGNDDTVADMESSLDMWETWLEKATSQCQTLNNGALSLASPISPGSFSCESSTTFLANTDTSFNEASQGCSDATSFATHQHTSFATYQYNPHHFYMNSPFDEQFDFNLGESSPISYDHVPFLQGFVNGSATSTTSTTDDDFFDTEASSFAAILSPPSHGLNWPRAEASPLSLNLDATTSWSQLNLEARASPPQQSASHHDISASKATRNTSNRTARQTGEAVSILVESSTPAIDDGHVWRKYGQKDIKDKIHPRSYYRCAQPNCPIKKHVEYSSDKQGFMLISYYGKHNH